MKKIICGIYLICIIISVGLIASASSLNTGYNYSSVVFDDNSLWIWGDGENNVPYNYQINNKEWLFGPNQLIDTDNNLWEMDFDKTNIWKVFNGKIVQFSEGSYSIFLTESGDVYIWGSPGLSSKKLPEYEVPEKMDIDDVTYVASGGDYVCMVKSDGSLWGWGLYEFLEDWNPDHFLDTPTKMDISNVNKVAAADRAVIAVKKDGTAWAWGSNYYGLLGNGVFSRQISDGFVQVSIDSVDTVDIGVNHAVAVKKDGTVWEWGSEFAQDEEIPTGGEVKRTPEKISGLKDIVSVSCGYYHSIALDGNGDVWTWGANFDGQLGNGTENDNVQPQKISFSNKNIINLNIEESDRTSRQLTNSITPTDSESKTIKVYVNDNKIRFDTNPFIENGRTLVPVRAIAQSMNFNVNWDGNTQTATFENDNKKVYIQINNNTISIYDNNSGKTENILIDVPAMIKNDRTYVPLRALSEAFGSEVKWNGDTYTVSITWIEGYDNLIEFTFADKGIEHLVRVELGDDWDEPYEEPITQDMLDEITNLDINDLGKDMKVYSIDDIKHLPNLKRMNMNNQPINDISPLGYIDTWQQLYLRNVNADNVDVLKSINVTNTIIFPNSTMQCHISDDKSYKYWLSEYQKLMDITNDLVDECSKKSMSDYDKYKFLHDYLINNMEYDARYVDSIYDEDFRDSAYIGLILGKGICHVYAETYKYLCDRCGLECLSVEGDSFGIVYEDDEASWGAHEWNMVNIEGNYYHVDVTYDDIGEDYGIRYDYFLLSDDELEAFDDHIWYKDEVPECKYTFQK